MKDLRNEMCTIGTGSYGVLLIDKGILQLDMNRDDIQTMEVYDEDSTFSTKYHYNPVKNLFLQIFTDSQCDICPKCGSYKNTDEDHIKNCEQQYVTKEFISDMIRQVVEDNKSSDLNDRKTILIINGIKFKIL